MQKKSVSFLCLLSVLIGLLFSVAKPALAGESIMPLQDIKPGMQGIAKTVIQGSKIVTFDVKVIDIVPGHGGKGDLILVRVGGPVIEKTGGIAQGMSGSPVYIKGKLIGAIGYGFEFADHNLGLVTPIGDMLKVLDMQDKQKKIIQKPIEVDGKKVNPLKTPLFVNGLRGRALEHLKEKLAPFNLEVKQGTGQGKVDTKDQQLLPGSALGVQLMDGYVEAGAIGTVTYVDQGKLLAFGHPFLNKGLVDLPLTTAYIHQTIPSIASPFKLGSCGQVVGRITQDRTAAIGGEIGVYSPTILVRMEITDKDLGKTQRTYCRVIKDRDLAGPLIISGLLGMLDNSLDRIGKGTAKISFQFKGKGLPDDSLERENMFFSPNDISAMSLTELVEGLDIVMNNVYNEVDVQELVVKVEVEEKEKTAYIQKAEAKKVEVYPGDTAEIQVTYVPFRAKAITSTIKVKIPSDIPPGILNLGVAGGNVLSYLFQANSSSGQGEQDNGAELMQQMNPPFNSLQEMIDDYLSADKNNEIVVGEMFNQAKLGSSLKSNLSDSKKKKTVFLSSGDSRADLAKISPLSKGEEDTKIKAVLSTPYVVQGYYPIMLKVLDKKEKGM